MKIAITGASGFIGQLLVSFLCKNGHHVRALAHSAQGCMCFSEKQVKTYLVDVTEKVSLREAFMGVDCVIHLAAFFNRPEASFEDYYNVNVLGTKNVLEMAMEQGVRRVVHCSTGGVAARAGTPPYSEQTPYSPPSWDKYETTKCEGEKLALDFYRTHNYPLVVIRPTQPYGPGDKSKAKFYRMVKKGIIVNPGTTKKHLIFIDDLCRAFEMAAFSETAVGEILIIGGSKPTSLKKLVRIVADELETPVPRIALPATPITWLCTVVEGISNILRIKPPLFRRSMDFFTKSVEFDVSKAERVLGFRSMVDVPTGVNRTAKWYKENNLL